eukprot:snap_masked-scaffold_32-processed-gene-2.32-mRNA-1 protein AED:1.00 eAED:1.00 QI:0/0/0/0/1/1/2/0/63
MSNLAIEEYVKISLTRNKKITEGLYYWGLAKEIFNLLPKRTPSLHIGNTRSYSIGRAFLIIVH